MRPPAKRLKPERVRRFKSDPMLQMRPVVITFLLLLGTSAMADSAYYNTFFLETGSFKIPGKTLIDSNPIQWDPRNVTIEYSDTAEITKYKDGSITVTYRSKK